MPASGPAGPRARPRLLIEDWLPAQAIGVECMRARGSASALEPTTFLHVWWARRPLTISRAAVLASLLPADFDRATFERLLGFYADGATIVSVANALASKAEGQWVAEGHGKRAFTNSLREKDLDESHRALRLLWGDSPRVLDPMAGGGSIPFEAARLGLRAFANELNPVACTVQEATLIYPFQFGASLTEAARMWSAELLKRVHARLVRFFAYDGQTPPRDYIFARTVPCPDTGHPTPLVPDWSLSRPKGGRHMVAEPTGVDSQTGRWSMRVREVGRGAGQLGSPPAPTYKGGKGWSLFTRCEIPSDYIKAQAQKGNMGSVLYAVAVKAAGLEFRPPTQTDLDALAAAEQELARIRPQWERENVIPTEEIPRGDKTKEPMDRGLTTWANLFSPRQLLALGTLVEELRKLRPEIIKHEGAERGEAIVHLLAFVIDKFSDYTCFLNTWESTRLIVKHLFQRHDFSFKATFAEMAACVAGGGLEWAADNVLEAYEKIAALPKALDAQPVTISRGSATALYDVEDGSITAVVVDPPYSDNVQYSELADFFYVWLKRTQGHRRPEWFSTYLCDHSEEAVVNVSRHRDGAEKAAEAKLKAHEFYQKVMTEAFREAHRVLRDDGVLTVMFTHKAQSAWGALFSSLIDAGFSISATWPVQTESQHSLHQARKNAAQSTVLLVARKRDPDAGIAYYNDIEDDIRQAARSAAARLREQGLNSVDQLVGAFGPAMEVLTRYSEVRTGVNEGRVNVTDALQTAAAAVADWREEQLAQRGLAGVDSESRFFLLCWDVLAAAEVRFNEVMMLGRAVGMDVDRMKETGLVEKVSEKVKLLPASARRREKPIHSEQEQMTLLGLAGGGRGKRGAQRKVHPQDEYFATAIDVCHALALRYQEAGGGPVGIGAVRQMALKNNWKADAPCARLMEALVAAAPVAVRFAGKGKATTAADLFPEFRAWHEMLQPLFGTVPPEWKQAEPPKNLFTHRGLDEATGDDLDEEFEDSENEENEEE